MKAGRPAKSPARAAGKLRIVGGAWRGRRLDIPPVEGLRPTPDRVRETLFNWLQPVIAGARCLDLFAGSGALGLEAVSRGAAEAVLVDAHPEVAGHLRTQVAVLGAEAIQVAAVPAASYLQGPPRPFDVVFLDPPFRQGLLGPCCAALESGGWLASPAWIYLEAEAELGVPDVPGGWSVIRSKRAGDVGYHLAVRGPA